MPRFRSRTLLLAIVLVSIIYFLWPKDAFEPPPLAPPPPIEIERPQLHDTSRATDWTDSLGVGVPKPPGSAYSRTLVISSTHSENVSWIAEKLPDVDTRIYYVDDLSAKYHTPRNKGHEAQAYLTYLIDAYNDLPDVIIFMHAHQITWHNNDLLNNDASQMIRALSNEHVWRHGYVNLRCHWSPGCPAWVHPGHEEQDTLRNEDLRLGQSFRELFPLEPVPQVLAQPCCAQFALSRKNVLAIPRPRYVYWRDWISRTNLDDYTSGRVFEYLWQFMFTGHAQVCPEMHKCYCDGFGVCFGTRERFEYWFELRYKQRVATQELKSWQAANETYLHKYPGRYEAPLNAPDPNEALRLQATIDTLQAEMKAQQSQAVERGKNPQMRALECGRAWQAGDGF